MSYFEREQKYNMKYEIWRAWAKIWNMKYENIKIQRTKNVTISGFFFANMKYENFFIWKKELHIFRIKYEIWKYGNMSYFEREQKYNMKYEIWRAWAKIWNMKYENIKIQRTKNVTISGFFFANMKYENFFILAWNTESNTGSW